MDYSCEEKLKRQEIEEHENRLREKSDREREEYLSIGNRQERRRLRALAKK